MAESSGISWTDNTFNPWMGCTKVSPACKNCYAERDMDHRFGKVQWGPTGTRSITSDANWLKPLKWNKEAGKSGVRYKVFCASLADVFEDWNGRIVDSNGKTLWESQRGTRGWVPDDESEGFAYEKKPVTMSDVRQRLFDLIDATPNLDWLLLTKRPENICKMWTWKRGETLLADADMQSHRNNVWIGTSVENQEYAEKRIPELLKCRDLAPVLFLSCEPLLGPVNLTDVVAQKSFYGDMDLHPNDRLDALRGEVISGMSGCQVYDSFPSVDWVISGGESGPNARPSNPDWFRSLRDQCQAADVTYHFKQWGEWLPQGQGTPPDDWHNETKYAGKIVENNLCIRVGVKASGRLLDGVLHNEFPNLEEK